MIGSALVGTFLGVFLAYGIVGLAEAASRWWVLSGRQENPALLGSRIADLAWAGLRGVHR